MNHKALSFTVSEAVVFFFYKYKVSKHHHSKTTFLFCSDKKATKIIHSSKVDVLCEIQDCKSLSLICNWVLVKKESHGAKDMLHRHTVCLVNYYDNIPEFRKHLTPSFPKKRKRKKSQTTDSEELQSENVTIY